MCIDFSFYNLFNYLEIHIFFNVYIYIYIYIYILFMVFAIKF